MIGRTASFLSKYTYGRLSCIPHCVDTSLELPTLLPLDHVQRFDEKVLHSTLLDLHAAGTPGEDGTYSKPVIASGDSYCVAKVPTIAVTRATIVNKILIFLISVDV